MKTSSSLSLRHHLDCYSSFPIPKNLPPPIPLTKSSSSWIIHIPKFFRPPTRQVFHDMFDTHPPDYHPLFLFGKKTFENRYSQLFVTDASSVGGRESYRYSGTSKECVTCDSTIPEQKFVQDLCQVANTLLWNHHHEWSAATIPSAVDDDTLFAVNNKEEKEEEDSSCDVYNCCLVNWYRPEHSIGLHSDDEMEMNLNVPIMSLSWGGPRRFLLRPKPKTLNDNQALSKLHEVLLKDGDLLIMGGKCQEEFKHEVPKVRKKDGLVGDRISWTIRCMKPGPASARRNNRGGGTGGTGTGLGNGNDESTVKKRKR